jgi:putative transposase
MKKLTIKEGDTISCQDRVFTITRLLNLKWVLGQEHNTSKIEKLRIDQLMPYTESEKSEVVKPISIDLTTEEDWQIASSRLKILEPILNNRGNGKLVGDISKTSGVSKATLYRWVELYDATNLLSSLVPKENLGGKGNSRLPKEIDTIIQSVIEDSYLTSQKKSVQHICKEVAIRCKNAKIQAPHSNTVRYRINQISEYHRLKGRYGTKAALQKFAPKTGSFPGADYPLSVVQIDHTKLDIIVVDEIHRRPIGRPWITMAIDIHSRMCSGFYISLDPPGAMGTGLCICHSILPKEKWLAKMDIDGEWPCWGVMKTIHVDNAREFKGHMIRKACEEHNIQLEWRPVATPHYGGHIERLLGTFLREIHTLPGTTFANIKDRKNYNSEKKAVFTLNELEKWLTTFIVNIYHKRIHKTIETTPFTKYNDGIFGTNEQIGIGIPPRIIDERKLRLDFMPFVERTIQDYGVVIDNIYYYHDIMRHWINSSEPIGGKQRAKRKFIFIRDPRDISTLYFLDPVLNEYFPIPYRNISRPAMSIWEFNEVVSKLKDQGKEVFNEDMIFEAYEVLKKIEADAVQKTIKHKKTRGKALKRMESRGKINSYKKDFSFEEVESTYPVIKNIDVKPFNDLEL